MNKIIIIISIILVTGCQITGNKEDRAKNEGKADNIEVKKFYSEGKLVKEVSFKNDIRNGICRNYYTDGRLKRTIWYENGIKEDTAKWYYREGMVYRATPYNNDRIHGTQTKYYKEGRVMATIPYKNGLRMQGLVEYLPDGRKVENYPTITYNIRDLIGTSQNVLKVFARLSNESVDVRFYKGSMIDGVFDPDKCIDITSSSGIGYFELKPDNANGKGYTDVIAVYRTRFGNKKILTRRIELPHNNLI